MTSFTPQGGGETPKALSSRVLVAAYWLFVVLMLATFTANLAAFLTVERQQNTIKSLEELNRQSKILYTVLRDSPYLEYFQVRREVRGSRLIEIIAEHEECGGGPLHQVEGDDSQQRRRGYKVILYRCHLTLLMTLFIMLQISCLGRLEIVGSPS